MPQLLLRMTSITKRFAGVCALKAANFELTPGEVHALVGENGAGKSTLIKVMTGAVRADSGTLEVKGRVIHDHNPGLARDLGIAAIYQQPSLFPDLSVAENIALALDTRDVWRQVNWRSRRRRAGELLERAGASIDTERLAASLSMAEQQIVEIAKAIGADAKILIMDEPTASLTEVEVERLFRVIAAFRSGGAGVVYISHRMEEVFTVADRITVLRDGETVATRGKDAVTQTELVRMMVGRELAASPPHRQAIENDGDVALELRHVSSTAVGLSDITLHLRRGEILGVAGLVGSGRTELAETIFGLHPADAGEILVNGKPVRITSPADAINQGIAYVPEDRRRHGVVLEMPITSNISLASLPAVSPRGLLDCKAEGIMARTYIGQLRIKTSSEQTLAGTLSGGNQQKVALARWLATNPAILILDEPTQGVDVGSKREIHRWIAELAARGMAVLMISSELPEILGISDRIAVMHAGRLLATLRPGEASAEKVMAVALGHQQEYC